MDAVNVFTITLPVPLVMICDAIEPALLARSIRLFVPSVIFPLVHVSVPLIVTFPPGTTPPFPFIVTLFAVNPGID